MRHRLTRWLLRLCAVTAAALCTLLLIESVRSFYQTDTVSLPPLTFVTHRGSLYVLPRIETFGVESQPVTGAPPWPVTLVPVPLGTWNQCDVLGFNGWVDDGLILVKFPIWFALLPLALFALCCHRRYAEILPRTHYLQCPSCGHLLAGVVHWRCPECGRATQSRVIEALAPRPPRITRMMRLSSLVAQHAGAGGGALKTTAPREADAPPPARACEATSRCRSRVTERSPSPPEHAA